MNHQLRKQLLLGVSLVFIFFLISFVIYRIWCNKQDQIDITITDILLYWEDSDYKLAHSNQPEEGNCYRDENFSSILEFTFTNKVHGCIYICDDWRTARLYSKYNNQKYKSTGGNTGYSFYYGPAFIDMGIDIHDEYDMKMFAQLKKSIIVNDKE